jgi:ribonuclease E
VPAAAKDEPEPPSEAPVPASGEPTNGAVAEAGEPAVETDGVTDAEDAAVPKKRTRRGSRGGRGRKRATAPTAEAEAADGPAAATDDGAEAVATAAPGADGYVPMSEWIDDLDR